MNIDAFVRMNGGSKFRRGAGLAAMDSGLRDDWFHTIGVDSSRDTILVLIDIWPSESSTHEGLLSVRVHDVWHEIGSCLMFFTATPAGRSTLEPESQEPVRWRDFVVSFGAPATILPRRSMYQELLGLLGDDNALRALERVNDVSALRLLDRAASKLRGFMKLVDLVRLLSVDTEAFLAYTTLPRYIGAARSAGLPPPQRMQCTVESGPEVHTVYLQFPIDPMKGRQTICALIGPNGAGKTRALYALTKQDWSAGTWPQQVLLCAQDKANARSSGVGRSTHVKVQPLKPQWSAVTKKFEDISLRCMEGSTDIEVVERLFGDVVPLNSLYVPLNSETVPLSGDSKYEYRNDTFYISYIDFLRSVSGGNQLLLQPDVPTLICDAAGGLHLPSSGESMILSLLASIYVDAKPSTLVLIDEPETNLHPRFIALLMTKLADILLATDSLAVIATHSPFVVRELDKSAVTVMKRGLNQETEVLYPTLQTHGASVGEISSFVFEDHEVSKGFEFTLEAIASRKSLSQQDTIRIASELFGSDAVSFALMRGYK